MELTGGERIAYEENRRPTIAWNPMIDRTQKRDDERDHQDDRPSYPQGTSLPLPSPTPSPS